MKCEEILKKFIRVLGGAFLAVAVLGLVGCGEDNDDDDGSSGAGNSIQVYNYYWDDDMIVETVPIDIYIDGNLRRQGLDYGNSETFSGLSDGSHTLSISATEGHGTYWYPYDTTFTVSGQALLRVAFSEDGIQQM